MSYWDLAMICMDEVDTSQKMDMISATFLASRQGRALIKGLRQMDVIYQESNNILLEIWCYYHISFLF